MQKFIIKIEERFFEKYQKQNENSKKTEQIHFSKFVCTVHNRQFIRTELNRSNSILFHLYRTLLK